MNPRHRILLAASFAVALGAHGDEAVEPAAQLPSAPVPVTSDTLSIESAPRPPQTLTVRVLSEHPHDPRAFTQGLLLNGDVFLESTGQYGQSELREVDIASGVVMRSQPLPPNHFGEGLALVGERLIQLTWREKIAHVWDVNTFERIGEFTYTGEGWGLVYDGERLIMSNGSDRLQFRDPDTFEVRGEIHVKLAGEPVRYLNELSFAEGLIWANVWQQDFIVGIDPATGHVTRIVDARALRTRLVRAPGAPAPEVLNGIAYNPAENTYYLTGKNWPTMFEVLFVPAP